MPDAFVDALQYAARIHAGQARKGEGAPYIVHPLAVCSLVLEDGGDWEQAIGGLLHDAAEDQGGRARLDDIRRRFGERVADIVEGCSEWFEERPGEEQPPWRERKEGYLAHLPAASEDVVRVSLADKVHNARSILFDYRRLGDALWERFNRDADEIWYYRALLEAFRKNGTESPLVDELERTVDELERLMKAARVPGRATVSDRARR
jgi:(p)ppGpp synthase/HD superfamily hydrolase